MKRLWKTAFLGGLTLLLCGVILWMAMDHVRGNQWAAVFVRFRFSDGRQISTDGLESWLAEKGAERVSPVILDARSAEEYTVSHLPGAVSTDMEKPWPESLREINPQTPIVVYCSAGYRSCQLALALHQRGFNEVQNLEGGIFRWANEGRILKQGEEVVEAVHPYHTIFSRLLKPEARMP